jgi:hypothetical protein
VSTDSWREAERITGRRLDRRRVYEVQDGEAHVVHIHGSETRFSDGIRGAAVDFVEGLREGPRTRLAIGGIHSDSTIDRALRLLKDHGAPIEYDHTSTCWSLADPGWVIPAAVMTREQLEAEVDRLRAALLSSCG